MVARRGRFSMDGRRIGGGRLWVGPTIVCCCLSQSSDAGMYELMVGVESKGNTEESGSGAASAGRATMQAAAAPIRWQIRSGVFCCVVAEHLCFLPLSLSTFFGPQARVCLLSNPSLLMPCCKRKHCMCKPRSGEIVCLVKWCGE